MARPAKPIDLRQVEELARIGCTEEDMAAVLGVSVDTIQRRKRSCPEFRGVIEKGRASLRNSLRRLQVKKALEGNTTMLIWLGKQLLGQKDARQVDMVDPATRERMAALEAALAGELGVGGSAGGPGIDDGGDARAETDRIG